MIVCDHLAACQRSVANPFRLQTNAAVDSATFAAGSTGCSHACSTVQHRRPRRALLMAARWQPVPLPSAPQLGMQRGRTDVGGPHDAAATSAQPQRNSFPLWVLPLQPSTAAQLAPQRSSNTCHSLVLCAARHSSAAEYTAVPLTAAWFQWYVAHFR